jgi:hypothetical protein
MLAETQIRLEEHFAALAADRSAQGYPVYGLEHGLEPGEVETLRHCLTEDLGTFGHPRARYWLIWIAIAERHRRSAHHHRSSSIMPVLRRPYAHCRGLCARRCTARPALRRRDPDLIR